MIIQRDRKDRGGNKGRKVGERKEDRAGGMEEGGS